MISLYLVCVIVTLLASAMAVELDKGKNVPYVPNYVVLLIMVILAPIFAPFAAWYLLHLILSLFVKSN